MFVLEQIHKTAAADPGRLAVVFNGAPITYDGFWRIIEARRRWLAPQVPDRGIALVWTDSLLDSWILDLALRSLGVDTGCIQSREQLDLYQGLDVACVVSLASDQVRPVGGLTSVVVGDPVGLSERSDGPPLPDDLKRAGHIKFTSGTTGRYKKVPSTFGATADAIEKRSQRYAELDERVVRFGERPVLNAFNMGLWTGGGYNWPIFIWCLGGAMVFQQTEDLHRALTWPGITHTLATPWHLSRLMALPEGAFPFNAEMQLFVISGAVAPALARETMRRLTPKIMINLSSTETGVWASTVVDAGSDLRRYRLDSTRRVEVVDEAGLPLGPGQLGKVRVELHGDDAAGYLGDAENSGAAFSDGWFYPGDLGVFDSEGRLELCGRSSDVIHINGEKYPAEPWERAIQEKLACEAVCVLSSSWPSGAEELHVFIETRRVIPAPELAEAVRSTLAGFAECHVHVVDSLPRTETAKIKRIVLAQRLREGAFEVDRSRRH